ncbi:hypothetical protein C8E03_10795 [Lachnotalea glycerini]|uniref:Uncharacterized protein n=1 Tax=Lachnotalea glycerini TaxID=1763509 RepID=A0A318EPZ2_9FIRM|nr:hypothetical protein [Lachnotalea glycerini]PXV89118.1 hypothetical protein C8E03_10795 [Lachnotalea glycerini]
MEQEIKFDMSEKTNREILRFQLEQLAEVSKDCLTEELSKITSSMIEIVSYLENNQSVQ